MANRHIYFLSSVESRKVFSSKQQKICHSKVILMFGLFSRLPFPSLCLFHGIILLICSLKSFISPLFHCLTHSGFYELLFVFVTPSFLLSFKDSTFHFSSQQVLSLCHFFLLHIHQNSHLCRGLIQSTLKMCALRLNSFFENFIT